MLSSTNTKTLLTYYIKALKAIMPEDSNLLQLERMISDDDDLEKPKESILFSGTRLRCEELEGRMDALMSKLMDSKFYFRDDVYDAMNEVRRHEQQLCELEEYLEADLPAKECFLTNNCANMRTRLRVMMNFLQAKLDSTMDESEQTEYILRPYRRNLHHAKKAIKSLQYELHTQCLSNEEIEAKLTAVDTMIASAEENDFKFDPCLFNFGREALLEEKTRLVDEWRNVMRELRTIKRALRGLSPLPSPIVANWSPPTLAL